MYRDFINKQTSDFDSQFKAKTLVGNWYEQRCNPQAVENFHFYKQRKIIPDGDKKPTLTKDNFQKSTNNWLNFQQIPIEVTFKTEYKDNYLEKQKQKRLSVLLPFITKKGELQKNQHALNQYRNKWTKSKHVYDSSRTAIGHNLK